MAAQTATTSTYGEERREKPMGEKKGEERCRHKFLSATTMVLYLMLWLHTVLVNYVCFCTNHNDSVPFTMFPRAHPVICLALHPTIT